MKYTGPSKTLLKSHRVKYICLPKVKIHTTVHLCTKEVASYHLVVPVEVSTGRSGGKDEEMPTTEEEMKRGGNEDTTRKSSHVKEFLPQHLQKHTHTESRQPHNSLRERERRRHRRLVINLQRRMVTRRRRRVLHFQQGRF